MNTKEDTPPSLRIQPLSYDESRTGQVEVYAVTDATPPWIRLSVRDHEENAIVNLSDEDISALIRSLLVHLMWRKSLAQE